MVEPYNCLVEHNNFLIFVKIINYQMIPREEILKQINRFYDMLESINKQIEERKGTITDETDRVEMDKNFKLLRTYFKLTSKVGTKMQDAIDDLKNQLDIIEDK